MNETDIPEGVQDIVRTRVSRLAEGTKRMLVLAAVAGDEFEFASVGAAGRFEDEDLLAALDEALAASLVVELASSPPRHRFAHAIVRASLYEQLSGPRKLHLHRAVGQAIEAVHGAHFDEHLPRLAHHFAHVAAGGLDVAVLEEFRREAFTEVAALRTADGITLHQAASFVVARKRS